MIHWPLFTTTTVLYAQFCVSTKPNYMAVVSVSPAVYKAWVCGRSFAGIARSNTAGGIYVCLVNVVFLCHGPITFPEESCRVWWVWFLIPKPQRWGALGPLGLSSHKKCVCQRWEVSMKADLKKWSCAATNGMLQYSSARSGIKVDNQTYIYWFSILFTQNTHVITFSILGNIMRNSLYSFGILKIFLPVNNLLACTTFKLCVYVQLWTRRSFLNPNQRSHHQSPARGGSYGTVLS